MKNVNEMLRIKSLTGKRVDSSSHGGPTLSWREATVRVMVDAHLVATLRVNSGRSREMVSNDENQRVVRYIPVGTRWRLRPGIVFRFQVYTR